MGAQKTRKEMLDAEVSTYLKECMSLREALGISRDAHLEKRLLGMGEHNVNFAFGEPEGTSFVLRVNVASQPFHDNQILYEYGVLQSAYSSGCTPQPLFLDYGDNAPAKGILVESFCEGTQLDFDSLKPGEVLCAIQMIADVHSVVPKPNCSMFRPSDPLTEMFKECLARYENYLRSGYENARITRWTQAFIKATEKMLKDVSAPEDCNHIVNTEPLPSHFLIPETSAIEAAKDNGCGRLCASPGYFVDWERSLLGEVAQDVAYFVSPTTTYWDSAFLFPAQDVSQVIEKYWQAVDGRFAPGNFEERFWAWRMMTALKSTTWCVQAIARYSGNEETHTTEKTAGKLPVYLSDEFMERIAYECFGLGC